MHSYIKYSVLSLVSVILVACGSSSDSSGGDAALPIDLTDKNVLITKISTGTTTEYINDYGISLDSSVNYILRIIPDLQQADVIDSATRTDYAPTNVNPLTLNGDLYTLRSTNNVTGHKLRQFDPSTGATLRGWDFSTTTTTSVNNLAVCNDLYFNRDYYDFQLYRGTLPMDNILNQPVSQSVAASANTFSELYASDTKLFDIQWNNLDGSLQIYERNTTTGTTITTVTSRTLSTSNIGWRYFKVDRNNDIYMLTVPSTGTVISIEKIVGNLRIDSVLSVDTVNLNSPYMNFDVDNGYIMLSDNDTGYVNIYDTNTATTTEYSLGIAITGMELMHNQ